MTRNKSGVKDFIISVRLTIVLLAAIDIGALFGTAIPQQEAVVDFAARLQPPLWQ
jgi:hypothetical protein